MAPEKNISTLAGHLFRENSGKMVAVLLRIFGLNHIDRVTDVVQDAFETALVKWKYEGIPINPAGWLMQVARNKAINVFKREAAIIHYQPSAFASKFDRDSESEVGRFFLPDEIDDSSLRLLLTCCHHDFSEKNQVILTLNILCGFGVAEISNALMMEDEAVKKALARSKALLKGKGHILQTPSLLRYEKRIRTVHTILYLMFNEGYKTTRGKKVIDHDLCYEAMRLAKLFLRKNVVLHGESCALLSLMFFNLARFPSRIGDGGEIITLAEQDRKKWNKAFIEEGYHYLKQIGKDNVLSRYHLEALIASVHCCAGSFKTTDWKTIIYLYEQLEIVAPSPLVTLNKIFAESHLHNPGNRMREIEKLKKEGMLQKNHLLYAAEGDILLRKGNLRLAIAAFAKACELVSSPLERQFLMNKLKECRANANQ